MPRQRSKRWCFTLNNYTQEDEERIQGLVAGESLAYVVYGREVGESGTPHLQGYLEVSSRIGIRKVKEMIGRRSHLEIARGSLETNQTYCKKQEDYFEEGSPIGGQGVRSDLLSVKADIDAGMEESAIADKHFGQWVRYSKSFRTYRALKACTPRNWKTVVSIFWGKTGTGKTRQVFENNEDVYVPGDYKWFDGYRGQEVVLLDDFRGEYDLQYLLKLLDRYPMQVPIKGGFVTWCPKQVFITSNVNPIDWYKDADARSIAALFRRIENNTNVLNPLFDDIE